MSSQEPTKTSLAHERNTRFLPYAILGTLLLAYFLILIPLRNWPEARTIALVALSIPFVMVVGRVLRDVVDIFSRWSASRLWASEVLGGRIQSSSGSAESPGDVQDLEHVEWILGTPLWRPGIVGDVLRIWLYYMVTGFVFLVLASVSLSRVADLRALDPVAFAGISVLVGFAPRLVLLERGFGAARTVFVTLFTPLSAVALPSWILSASPIQVTTSWTATLSWIAVLGLLVAVVGDATLAAFRRIGVLERINFRSFSPEEIERDIRATKAGFELDRVLRELQEARAEGDGAYSGKLRLVLRTYVRIALEGDERMLANFRQIGPAAIDVLVDILEDGRDAPTDSHATAAGYIGTMVSAIPREKMATVEEALLAHASRTGVVRAAAIGALLELSARMPVARLKVVAEVLYAAASDDDWAVREEIRGHLLRLAPRLPRDQAVRLKEVLSELEEERYASSPPIPENLEDELRAALQKIDQDPWPSGVEAYLHKLDELEDYYGTAD